MTTLLRNIKHLIISKHFACTDRYSLILGGYNFLFSVFPDLTSWTTKFNNCSVVLKEEHSIYLLWFTSLNWVINHSIFLYISRCVTPWDPKTLGCDLWCHQVKRHSHFFWCKFWKDDNKRRRESYASRQPKTFIQLLPEELLGGNLTSTKDQVKKMELKCNQKILNWIYCIFWCWFTS